LLLAVGMACSSESVVIDLTECATLEEGAACSNGEGICQNGACQLKLTTESCSGKEDGTACDSGNGTCQGGICHITPTRECADKTDDTPCDSGNGVCQGGLCHITPTRECAGKADDTPCDNGNGVCRSGICQITPVRECAGKENDTPCDSGNGVCRSGICQIVLVTECAGKTNGTPCGNGVCFNNACEAPELVPCSVGSGTYCADGKVCRRGVCVLSGTLDLSAVDPSTPLSPIHASTTFFVTVFGFENNGDANSVSVNIGTVPAGLKVSPEGSQNPGLGTVTFTFKVTYDDNTTAFPSGAASIPFTLTNIPSSYTLENPSGNVSVSIRDGQEKIPSRVIWVNKDNILAFNEYARTLAGRARHYRLIENVTLPPAPAGQSNWKIIGNADFPFIGSFDGDGKTITELTIHIADLNYQSMFGFIGTGAIIENLGLIDVSVTGQDHVGSLVGQNNSGARVRNCYVINSVANSNRISVNGRSFVGGLVGQNEGTVEDSYAKVNVKGSGNSVGGLVGYNYSAAGRTSMVQTSYATGNVEGSGNNVGGLVGYNHSSGSGRSTVKNSYAMGEVTSIGHYVGGLVGYNVRSGNTGTSTVEDCYATGEVSGRISVGGLMGHNSGTLQNSMALNPKVISTSTSNVGRVAGGNNGDTLEANFAFGGMLNGAGASTWPNTGLNARDGESKSVNALQVAEGFHLAFRASPWTHVDGRLPGLFGQTVAMPLHLQ